MVHWAFLILAFILGAIAWHLILLAIAKAGGRMLTIWRGTVKTRLFG